MAEAEQGNRRTFLKNVAGLSGLALATSASSGMLAACSRPGSQKPNSGTGSSKPTSPPKHPTTVRVASVYVPITSGLMDALIKGFEPQSNGLTITPTGGSNVLSTAKSGDADLVICHYGHTDDTPDNYSLEKFISARLGTWPRAVFSSQAVLVGVPGDPAGIAGMSDLPQAFRQIATRGTPFIVDNTDYLPYLSDYITRAAGVTQGSWYMNLGSKAHAALADATSHNGYTLWGGVPFWAEAQGSQTSLKPFLWADPALQRMMVSVVVDPQEISGSNAEGATAFQNYLLTPEAQATIRDFRVPGFSDAPLFWPAGVQNNPYVLPVNRQGETGESSEEGNGSGGAATRS